MGDDGPGARALIRPDGGDLFGALVLAFRAPAEFDAELKRLGERFFRVMGTGASGSGLGWSIVRRITAVHGARASVGTSAQLGGLKVEIDAVAVTAGPGVTNGMSALGSALQGVALLMRPLPVREPGELVNLGAPGPKPGSQSCNEAGDCEAVFSYAMFRDLETAQPNGFTGIAAHRLTGVSLGIRNEPSTAEAMLVSGSYFPVLGLAPAAGRVGASPRPQRHADPEQRCRPLR